MKRPFNPDKEILNYCKHICNAHVQVLRQNHDTKIWYWGYPAVAAICHDEGCILKRSSYSHHPVESEYNNVLKKKLSKLGKIGKRCKKPGKRNVIGNCAEQHAANLYMKQYGEKNLNNLFFTKALRPRTKQKIPYCDNCKDTFPNI